MSTADKIANPTKFFESPDEVKNSTELSIPEKIKLLENWLDDVKLKFVAEEESMLSTTPAPQNFVKEINALLEYYNEKVH